MVELFGALELLMILGATVVIGYVGYAIFNKTKIPDVIWLVVFGLLLGPVFNLVDRSVFISMIPFFSALAIMVILFDAGLNLNIYRVIRTVPKSFVLAILNIVSSILVVGFASYFFFNFDLMSGFILGAIIGGTSSPVVIALVERVQVREIAKDVLKLESVITDPLAIVTTIALIGIASQAAVAPQAPIAGIISVFSVGAVLGFIAGLIWLFVLDKLKGRLYDHMLTLSIAAMLYASVEVFGGSGAIAALLFGLVLGNGKSFSIMLRFRKIFSVSSDMKKFQDEISFFIRSFFFVFLGMMVVISVWTLIAGIIIAGIMMVLRAGVVKLTFFRSDFTPIEKVLCITTAPRGMSAAVLAFLPGITILQNGEFFSEIVFVVIMATVIYSSISSIFLSRRAEKIAVAEDRAEKAKSYRSRRRPKKVPSSK